MNRRVVYTCIIGGYDRAFPPLRGEADTDYIIFSDNPNLKVRGWETRKIDPDVGKTASQINRYYKVFCYKVLAEYRFSLYLDGNIRPIGPLSGVFDIVEKTDAQIALQSHHQRRYVSDEVETCIRAGRAFNETLIRQEYKTLLDAGFEDTGELTENNILLREHEAPALKPAMEMWWTFISTLSGRDQISLPHVLQKTGLIRTIFPFHVRDRNPYFQFFPHFGELRRLRGRLRAYCAARTPESVLFRIGHRLLTKTR